MYRQQMKRKRYALHAPEAVCIAKAKTPDGSKASVTAKLTGNWALDGTSPVDNPYDARPTHSNGPTTGRFFLPGSCDLAGVGAIGLGDESTANRSGNGPIRQVFAGSCEGEDADARRGELAGARVQRGGA